MVGLKLPSRVHSCPFSATQPHAFIVDLLEGAHWDEPRVPGDQPVTMGMQAVCLQHMHRSHAQPPSAWLPPVPTLWLTACCSQSGTGAWCLMAGLTRSSLGAWPSLLCACGCRCLRPHLLLHAPCCADRAADNVLAQTASAHGAPYALPVLELGHAGRFTFAADSGCAVSCRASPRWDALTSLFIGGWGRLTTLWICTQCMCPLLRL